VLGSFQIARIRGIPIRLHFSLIAMFAVLAVSFDGWLGIPAGVVLFGSVLLHELGHSVVAQFYRIPISSITLHLLGGMALMTRPPSSAKEEVHIAAAGPLVSFALGTLFAALAWLSGGASLAHPTLLGYAAGLNLLMGLFNLVPALPMDGGRIFRAALASRFGSLRATRIAARVSRFFAVGFLIAGLYTQWWSLMIIGALLLFMVQNEERIVEAQEAMRQRMQLDPDPFLPMSGARETREEFIDPYGRRYVVITRLVEP
jgi:Zn-dependent protease